MGLTVLSEVSPLRAAEVRTTEIGRYPLTLSLDWESPSRAVIEAEITIPAPLERVWAVLTAYDLLADFVPHLSYSRVLRRERERILLHQKGVLWLPLYQKPVELVLEVTETPFSQVQFQLLEEPQALEELADLERLRPEERDFLVYRGAWRMERVEGGTWISYKATVEPNFWMPDFVLSELQRQTAKSTFRAIIKRCVDESEESEPKKSIPEW